MRTLHEAEYKWLRTGEVALSEMLDAIDRARDSIRLEMYIFHTGPVADKFRDALVAACKRGLLVRVLIDAFGSAYLPDSFWNTFRESGGQFRWFNPLSLHHIFIRDHRKLLICDGELAFIGGFNIATEYCGDGLTDGWRDLGLCVRGPLTRELIVAYDDMFSCADFKHKPFARLRKSSRTKTVSVPDAQLLLGGPGRNNSLKRSLTEDLKTAKDILIITPYFVPTLKIRTLLKRRSRQGARIRIILPGKSDLPVVRMAAQSFYRRFLRAGVHIYEYQPSILHAKLFIIDDIVYAGSANLDGRSMNINYELMARLTNRKLVEEGREIFEDMLTHCKRIELRGWRKARTFWDRFKARMAHLVIARMDTFFATRQLRWWKLSLRKMRVAKKHKTLGESAD